jgi:hypothetical protein
MSKRGTSAASQAEQRQFWQMVFETHQASGLTVKQFCQNEGLAIGSFYRWKRELRASGSGPAGPLSIQAPPISEQGVASPRFHQIAQVTPSCPDLQIDFPAGIHLQVHGHCDRQLLREAVALLREVPC